VFPNGCAEFGVNSVSVVKARFVSLLLPLVLPVLPGGPGWRRSGAAFYAL